MSGTIEKVNEKIKILDIDNFDIYFSSIVSLNINLLLGYKNFIPRCIRRDYFDGNSFYCH